MRLSADDASQIRGYVDRLVAAGVVGLGMGVGLGARRRTRRRWSGRPSAGGSRCWRFRGRLPFIAISKAVSDLLAAEQSEAIRRAFAAQRELTRAALLPERSGAVVARLAREVAGWVAVLDASGRLLHACPAAEPEAPRCPGARGRSVCGRKACWPPARWRTATSRSSSNRSASGGEPVDSSSSAFGHRCPPCTTPSSTWPSRLLSLDVEKSSTAARHGASPAFGPDRVVARGLHRRGTRGGRAARRLVADVVSPHGHRGVPRTPPR